MGLFRKKPELYSEAEIEKLESYIAETFGEFPTVLHEIVSPDIHADIAVVPPQGARDYITLVTMGMGAHRMNVPRALRAYRLERAELVICLPSGWRLDSEDERDYWPVRWLKMLARMPIEQNTWLGYGHTAGGGEPLADNTAFSALLLLDAFGSEKPYAPLTLPGGDIVRFYQLIPLYDEELQYKMAHNADALKSLFAQEDQSPIVRLHRKNYGLPTQ